jgi:hypothetical protein
MHRALVLVAALTSLAIPSASSASTLLQSPKMTYGHEEMRRPCPRSMEQVTIFRVRVASAAFTDGTDLRRVRVLSQCDCGNLRGCRCADAMWDSHPDTGEEEEEEGMDDQGYRQLGY